MQQAGRWIACFFVIQGMWSRDGLQMLVEDSRIPTLRVAIGVVCFSVHKIQQFFDQFVVVCASVLLSVLGKLHQCQVDRLNGMTKNLNGTGNVARDVGDIVDTSRKLLGWHFAATFLCFFSVKSI